MAKQQQSLEGKVVAITGGARGIGRATAQALIARGAKVAIGDLDGENTEQVARELGGQTLGLALDVTNPASFEAFLAQTERELGPLYALVNNAGVMPLGPLVQESEATARLIVDVNVHGVITGTKLALRLFTPRNEGHIVNVASAAGKIGFAGGASYSATKHAVVGLTEALRQELRGTAISAHLVMPVPVATELGAGLAKLRVFGQLQPEDVADAIIDAIQEDRFDNYVPRALGAFLAFGRAVPRGTSERMTRLLRGDRVLSQIDAGARADYEARIAPPEPLDQAKSVADAAASVASQIDS